MTAEKGSRARRRGAWTVGLLLVAALVVAGLKLLEGSSSTTAAGAPPRPSRDEAVDARELTRPESATTARTVEAHPKPSAPASTPPDRPDPSTTATGPESFIRGHVLTTAGEAVPRGRVDIMLYSRPFVSADLEPDGSFHADVRPGETYQVHVDQSSLPPGLLAPENQDVSFGSRGRPAYVRPGFFATEVVVPPEGGTFDVVVHVHLAAIVRGRVIGPRGEPVPHCWVRVQNNAPAYRGVATDTYADDAGRFELACPPGETCIVQVGPYSSTDERHHGLAVPLPHRLELREGDDVTVPTIRVGSGPNTVVGRLIDQWGAPWVDQKVRVFGEDWLETLLIVRTDARGAFELAGLEPAAVKVGVGDDYQTAERALGSRRPRWHARVLELDLRTETTRYDLGTVTVPASEPYFFEGRIVFARSLARDRERAMRNLSVDVEWLFEPAEYDTDAPWTARLGEAEIVEETGRILWSCETPHPPVRLVLKIHGSPKAYVEITPQPNRREERVVRYP